MQGAQFIIRLQLLIWYLLFFNSRSRYYCAHEASELIYVEEEIWVSTAKFTKRTRRDKDRLNLLALGGFCFDPAVVDYSLAEAVSIIRFDLNSSL